jgi:hypothetical protein
MSLPVTTLGDSVRYWRNRNVADAFAASERSLLEAGLDLSGAPDGSRPTARQFFVRLPAFDNAAMNTLELLPASPAANRPRVGIVLLHGFGSGLAFYHKTLPSLSKYTRSFRVLAVDWLGMGRSTRLKVPFKASSRKPFERICEVRAQCGAYPCLNRFPGGGVLHPQLGRMARSHRP